MIKDIFEDSDGTYGYRRIQSLLGRKRVDLTGRPSAPSCATRTCKLRSRG